METLKWVNFAIGIIFLVCYSYQLVYIPISLFGKKKHVSKKFELKRDATNRPTMKSGDDEIPVFDYAVLICARNEEKVICDLIDSIHAQTYPTDHIHIFLMADNCTDATAEIAANAGATVYTRNDTTLVGKGYALDLMLKNIKADYPEGFDAFFVFDADNILAENYFEEMNKCFAAGNDIITSYRNTKNYSNWISAGYGLWFLRESRYLNQSRSIVGGSSGVSGTGFLFSREIAEELNGWPFHMLTEDIEFTMYSITKGRKIAYCPNAELFDEQPMIFAQSWRQRLRWARGYWQVLFGYGKKMVHGMFHGSFSCYDMTMNIAPAFILSVTSIICNIALGIWGATIGDDVRIALLSFGQTLMNLCGLIFLIGFITTISEWSHIHASAGRKIWHAFTFPLFMATYIPISVASMFYNPSWKPIEHNMSVKEMEAQGIGMSHESSK